MVATTKRVERKGQKVGYLPQSMGFCCLGILFFDRMVHKLGG